VSSTDESSEEGAGASVGQGARRRLVMPAWQVVIAVAAAFVLGHYTAQRQMAQRGREEGQGQAARPMLATPMEEQVAARLAEMSDAEQVLAIANGHADSGKHRVAVLAYQRALELGVRSADLLTDLGVSLHALGDDEGAVARFREAAALDPKHAESRYNLGVVLHEGLHDEAGARAAWEEFLKVAPEHEKAEEVRRALGELGTR